MSETEDSGDATSPHSPSPHSPSPLSPSSHSPPCRSASPHRHLNSHRSPSYQPKDLGSASPASPANGRERNGAGNGAGDGDWNRIGNGNGNGQFLRVEDYDDDEEAQLLSPGVFDLDYEEDGPETPRQQQRGFRRRRMWSGVAARGAGLLSKLSARLGLNGPSGPPDQPALVHTITPPGALRPDLQGLPSRWLESRLPAHRQRCAALALFLCVWLVAFALPLGLSHFGTDSRGWMGGPEGGGGEGSPPAATVHHLDCTDTLWSRDNGCGLNGIDCRPFSNSSLAFHCPANCAGVRLLNPRPVGRELLNYRPLVVGGPDFYRGDSFLCAAAIHAGVVTDSRGGCGLVRRVGPAQNFPAVEAHGIRSAAFDSYFPLAFTVSSVEEAASPPAPPTAAEGGGGRGEGGAVVLSAVVIRCEGGESRGLLLAVNVVFSSALSLLTTSPRALFFPCFAFLFAHVALVSDPASVSRLSTAVLAELVSTMAARLLPALFVAVILYRVCVRRALGGGGSGRAAGDHPSSVPTVPPPCPQAEKTALWLLPFWLGALSNYTLDWIPISRLTAHDLSQQPGARAALAVIVALLALVVAQQAYRLWQEGRLGRNLVLYAGFVAAILTAVALPGLELRIHHYVLALLLLPGTAMQTRPSLAYQGLLLGLFVNGVARWGFASVLETASALRGDAAMGSPVPALLAPPLIQSSGSGLSSISFEWAPPPPAAGPAAPPLSSPERPPAVDGVSVLVNDVERHRAFFAEPRAGPGAHTGGAKGFVWARQEGLDLGEYFRFAFIRDGEALDYTRAGVWEANGTWTPLEGGVVFGAQEWTGEGSQSE